MPTTLTPTPLPEDGLYGVMWSRIPDSCLRPFADREQRFFARINERELSALPMHLVRSPDEHFTVQCMDISPTGFRITGSRQRPLPPTGTSAGTPWTLHLPSPGGKQLEVPVRLIWAQQRATLPYWEAGLERIDVTPATGIPSTFPEPCLRLPYPGGGLPVFMEHPLLFQEWVRWEAIAMNVRGEMLLTTQDSNALVFTGDTLPIKLALPTLQVKPYAFAIGRILRDDGQLFALGALVGWNARHAENLALSLHQGGMADARSLLRAGFHWRIDPMQIDVLGLSLGQESDRRVLGAFVDAKLVASLAYRLSTPAEGPPRLFIEGLSLKTEVEARREVQDRLFTMAARALLLSPYAHLEIHADEEQIGALARAGFTDAASSDAPPQAAIRQVLTRQAILWGLGAAFRPWMRSYRDMVQDLADKGLLNVSWTLWLWLRAAQGLNALWTLAKRVVQERRHP